MCEINKTFSHENDNENVCGTTHITMFKDKEI